VQQHYTHTQFNVNSLLSGKTSAPVKIDEIMAIKGQIPALSYIFAVFHQVQVLRRFSFRWLHLRQGCGGQAGEAVLHLTLINKP
jgi:hypothetical protein